MKKMMALVLIATLLLVSGCGGTDNTPAADSGPTSSENGAAAAPQTASDDATMVIGVIPKSTLFDFYKMVRLGAENAAQEEGYSINYQGTSTASDTATQQSIIEDMLVSGVDALVISTIDAAAVGPLLSSLDIPVVTFDDDIDPGLVVTTVTVDHGKASAAAAQYMVEKVPGGGKFVVISAEAGVDVIQQRDNGFANELAKHDGYELVGIYHSDGDREKAANIMQDMLTEHPDLAGVFACNEGAAAGIGMVLRDEGRQDLCFVGYDSSEELINNIYDGTMDALISQDPYSLGYNSVKTAIASIGGAMFDDVTESAFHLIDADNIHTPEMIHVLDPLGSLGLR